MFVRPLPPKDFAVMSSPRLCCDDRAPDYLWDLRDDRIPDGVVSVHPVGNPISASVKCGWIFQPCSPTSSCTRKTVVFLYRPVRLCRGIPNPLPSIEAVG